MDESALAGMLIVVGAVLLAATLTARLTTRVARDLSDIYRAGLEHTRAVVNENPAVVPEEPETGERTSQYPPPWYEVEEPIVGVDPTDSWATWPQPRERIANIRPGERIIPGEEE